MFHLTDLDDVLALLEHLAVGVVVAVDPLSVDTVLAVVAADDQDVHLVEVLGQLGDPVDDQLAGRVLLVPAVALQLPRMVGVDKASGPDLTLDRNPVLASATVPKTSSTRSAGEAASTRQFLARLSRPAE
jgi:hypothetical protein